VFSGGSLAPTVGLSTPSTMDVISTVLSQGDLATRWQSPTYTDWINSGHAGSPDDYRRQLGFAYPDSHYQLR